MSADRRWALGSPEVEILGSAWNVAGLVQVHALPQVASVYQEPNRLVVVFTKFHCDERKRSKTRTEG